LVHPDGETTTEWKLMCGRFTLRSVDRIRLALANRASLDGLIPRYNIAPTQDVIVVRSLDEAEVFQWGLIPYWSKEPNGIINARSETLETKPSFSESFQHRRCLILADGFYEWQRTGRARKAFYFQMKDEAPFAFAGIWDRWRNGNSTINSCAIITTTANGVLQPVHDRMPVILQPETYGVWLDQKCSPDELKKLLEPYPDDEMRSHPVSSQVNYTDTDGEDLVKRVDVELGTTPSLF
jgi:putative SOS response-associated peptidase YedK